MAALGSARADALQLLRADETDDTTRKLRRLESLDRALVQHLEGLKEALPDLPIVIAAMKEREKSAADLNSRRGQ